MTAKLVEQLRKLSEGSPQITSEGRPQECSRTGLPSAWCSHCTGAKLPTDEAMPIPTIHDGRHGKSCHRCMANIRAARRAVDPKGRYA